jgi:cytoskeletal protein CcmA (bactofilin family)
MFNKSDKQMPPTTTREPMMSTPAPAPSPRPTEPVEQKLNSIMGRGSSMSGNVKAEGSIRIDGQFEGTLESGDTLVVGKEGTVHGDVVVKRAVIGGRFEGNIHASVKVELHGGCEMFGEVVTPSLIIEEGVVFEGNCKMGSKSKAGETRSAGSNVPPRPSPQTQHSQSSSGASYANTPAAAQRV